MKREKFCLELKQEPDEWNKTFLRMDQERVQGEEAFEQQLFIVSNLEAELNYYRSMYATPIPYGNTVHPPTLERTDTIMSKPTLERTDTIMSKPTLERTDTMSHYN